MVPQSDEALNFCPTFLLTAVPRVCRLVLAVHARVAAVDRWTVRRYVPAEAAVAHPDCLGLGTAAEVEHG